MALEAVVYPQDPLIYSGSKDLYSLFGGGIWSGGSFDFPENQTENFPFGDWNSSSSVLAPSPDAAISRNGLIFSDPNPPLEAESRTPNPVRPRRRRPKTRKNKEEIENQRMTHIAVERNRRKQMNEYLSVLRSLMPDSYVQRVSLNSSIFVSIFLSSKQKFKRGVYYYYYFFRGTKLQSLGVL